MKEIHQPHDRFFRSVFSELDNARDLLRNVLPPRIVEVLDLESIELAEDSFIDERLSLYQSDILIRSRTRGSPVLIYLLVDHKSYPDRWTVMQLLVYMVRIWRRELAQRRKIKRLPCIIPIIFYHGARKWPYPLSFSSCVEAGEDLVSFVPDFRPVMFNLEEVDLSALSLGLIAKTALKAFKYALVGLKPHLRDIFTNLPDLPIDPKTRTFISQLLEYIMKVGGDTTTEDLEAELHAIESDLPREVLMTIEEQLLEKGRREGKLEGKLEGTIRDKQQILIRLLEKKFGPLGDDDEHRVLGHEDPANLDSAIDLILDADSVGEVLRPLN